MQINRTPNIGYPSVDCRNVHTACLYKKEVNKIGDTFKNLVCVPDTENKIGTLPGIDANNGISAVSIAETEDTGAFLGLTMIPEEGQSMTYGMRAVLSDKSTPDHPIVQVVSNLGGKKTIYNVDVNMVDPNNATQLEMFALLSYADKTGSANGGTFGLYQQLKVYGKNASEIGYCHSLSGTDVFLHEKFDWTAMMQNMAQAYYAAGIEHQAKDCSILFDFLNTYINTK